MCKVGGISLNSGGVWLLNYQVLLQNVFDDIQEPLQTWSRKTDVKKTFHIVRDAKRYALETRPQTKICQMVFNKRMVDPETCKTYPYEYFRCTTDDRDMAKLLLDLQLLFGDVGCWSPGLQQTSRHVHLGKTL